MAKLGTECCTPAPRYEYAEKGTEESFAGVDIYVTRPHSSEAASAVILASDVFVYGWGATDLSNVPIEVSGHQHLVSLAQPSAGWKVPQLRKIADAVAAAGLLALVPDFFYGDSFTLNPDGSAFPEVDVWLERHLPINSVGTLQKILEVLESKRITAYGISGYCWGAKLAMEVEKVVRTDALKSLVLLHPAFVTVEECRECRAPVAILAAELDHQLSMEALKADIEALDSRKEVDSFVKVYPGVDHGWTTRYDFANEAAVKGADEACEDMIKWHKKNL